MGKILKGLTPDDLEKVGGEIHMDDCPNFFIVDDTNYFETTHDGIKYKIDVNWSYWLSGG